MLEMLNDIFLRINVLSQNNQMIAGAISLWGLGTISYLVRNIPMNIYRFLTNNFVCSLFLTDESSTEIYTHAINKLRETRHYQLTRNKQLPFTISWEEQKQQYRNPTPIFCNGSILFLFEKRVFLARFTETIIQGRVRRLNEVKILTFGRNTDIIDRLAQHLCKIQAYCEKDKEPGYQVYKYNTDGDTVSSKQKRVRNPASVITHGNIVEQLIEQIEEFEREKQWYEVRGFNYKMVVLLHGPTGTGKTSIVTAIATHFGRDIYASSVYDLLLKGTDFNKKVPSNSICLFDDFDAGGFAAARDSVESESNTQNKDKNQEKPTFPQGNRTAGAMLGEFLNILDGVDSVQDCIIFLNTNCYDTLDPALVRKGRIDAEFYVGWLDHGDICRYINYYYQGTTFTIPEDIRFAKQPGSVLYDLFKQYKRDPQAFINALAKVEETEEPEEPEEPPETMSATPDEVNWLVNTQLAQYFPTNPPYAELNY